MQKTAKIVHLTGTEKTGFLLTALGVWHGFSQMSIRLKDNIVCYKPTKFELNRFSFGVTVTLNVNLVSAEIDPDLQTSKIP